MNTTNPYDIESLIAEKTQSNPKMKLLYEMMQQGKKDKKPKTNTKTDGQLKKLSLINNKLINRNKVLKRQQKKILKYLNFFIDVNTVFSSAVGACECWGEDNSCPNCKGMGNPGYYQIDENAFKTYIMPCMENVTEETTPVNETIPVNSRQEVNINHLSNN